MIVGFILEPYEECGLIAFYMVHARTLAHILWQVFFHVSIDILYMDYQGVNVHWGKICFDQKDSFIEYELMTINDP